MRLAVADFGFLPTAGVRVVIATASLLPLLWMRGQGRELLSHWRPVFVMGLLNSAIPFACYTFALQSITTGLSAILNATVPLFGAIVAWLWLGDRLNASRSAGLLVGFAGVALLAWDKASFKPGVSGIAPGWAVLACLVATLCYGIAASFAKRHMQGVPPLVSATGSQAGAAVGLALPTLWYWPSHWPGVTAWLSIVAVGVLCTGVAYVLYFRIIERAGPSRALAVTFMVPVFAVLYGSLFLGEEVTPWMLFCGLVIVCGTALSTGVLFKRRTP